MQRHKIDALAAMWVAAVQCRRCSSSSSSSSPSSTPPGPTPPTPTPTTPAPRKSFSLEGLQRPSRKAAATKNPEKQAASDGATPDETSKPRKRATAIYGEEGFESDILTRIEKKVEKTTEQLTKVPEDPEANVSTLGTGRGSKTQWSFMDAGPKGWWPEGERIVGAPPDKFGRPAKKPRLKKSPSNVTVKGVSSTERTREMRDVWLTRLGPFRRVAFSIGKRLTPQEIDMIHTINMFLKFLFVVLFVSLGFKFWELYKRYEFLHRYHMDSKINIMCKDILEAQSRRGPEYDTWWINFSKSHPIPNDLASEAELAWRELIKKGWVKLAPEEMYLIADEFKMTYIPIQHIKRDELAP